MAASLSEIEDIAHDEALDYRATEYVMDDARIGKAKLPSRQAEEGGRLRRAALAAIAALIALPLSYSETFGHVRTAVTASMRLAAMFPVLFVVWLIVIFGVLALLRRWFSDGFVYLLSAIGFLGACLFGLSS